MKPRQPTDLPTPKHVTEMAVQIGRELHPDLTWLRDGLLKIRLRHSGLEDTVVDLHNLYREIEAASTSPEFDLEAMLRTYLQTVPSASKMEIDQISLAAARGRILPLLKPMGFVMETTRRMAGRPDVQPLALPWVEDLVIMPVLDSPQSMAFLRAMDIRRWNVSEAQALQLALRNLERRSERIKLIDSRDADSGARFLIIQTHDGYDASRILLDRQRAFFARKLGEPYLVGVPNRDFLIAMQPALRAKLAPQVFRDYHRQGHPLTPRLLHVAGDGIRYEDAI